MNKKIITLFVICAVAISMASVCAVELTKENDFDGIFKMKTAEGDNFTNMSDPQSYASVLQSGMAYQNANGTVYVFVFGGDMGSALYFMSYGDIVVESEDCNITTTDGNLTVFNKTPNMDPSIKDYPITTFAGISSPDNKTTVFVGGNDTELVKEYAKTISFNK